MFKSSKKNNSPYNSKKRALIAMCLLFLVIVVILFLRGYQPTTTTMPQNTLPSAPSATSDTKPPETPEATYNEEPTKIRKFQLLEEDRQFLIEKGLKDPKNDLVQDLMKHNELILCKGTLGGTPGFYDASRIAVLNRDHVIADYDDGHVEGTIELTFIVLNGTISWKVVNSDCGD